MGMCVKTARGGLTFRVISFENVMEMVAMPVASTARWISPTDWLHRPQAGVSRAISTLSSLSFSATPGAVSLINVSRWRFEMCPMKEKWR